MESLSISLTFAVALAGGVLAQSLGRQLRIPGIVLLLALGVLLGPAGFGWVDPLALGEGLFDIVDFGVAIILFSKAGSTWRSRASGGRRLPSGVSSHSARS